MAKTPDQDRLVAVKAAYEEVAAVLKGPRMNSTLTLANGKVLGYSEVGDPQGAPVFVFLGLAGHRYLSLWFDALAKQHKLRILTVERPGKGTSWRLHPSKLKVLDWPGVVAEVADRLGIQRFSIIGHSCGTLFSLACALQLAPRIVGPICLVSPWTSLDVVGSNARLQMVRRWPSFIVRSGVTLITPLSKYLNRTYDPEVWVNKMQWYFGPNEAAALREPHNFAINKQAREAALREAGAQGYLIDVLLCLESYQSFGFRYTEIQHPVHIFHGSKDTMVPPAAVEWMRDKMPDCKLTFFEEGTHKLIADNSMLDQMFELIELAHKQITG